MMLSILSYAKSYLYYISINCLFIPTFLLGCCLLLLLISKSSFYLSMSVLSLPFVICILPIYHVLISSTALFLLAEILNFYIVKTINHFLCGSWVCIMLKRSLLFQDYPKILPYLFCDFTHCKRIP